MKRYILLLISICFLLFSTETKADYIVYVTKTGECYHIEGCSYLKSSIPISLEDAKEQGYRACSMCKPDSNIGETYTTKSNSANKTSATIVTVNEPNTTTIPQKNLATTNDKTENKNNNNFIENFSYLVVGGAVVYGIGKKKNKK
jgi:hypothetical protein